MKKVLTADPRRSSPPHGSANLFGYNEVSVSDDGRPLTRREGELIKRPELMSTRNPQVIRWRRNLFVEIRSGGAFELRDEGPERLDDLGGLHLTLLKRHLQAKRLPPHPVLEDETFGSPALRSPRQLASLLPVDMAPRDLLHQSDHFLWRILSNYL